MDETLRKLVWFLLNIGEVKPGDLVKPGALLWSLTPLVLRAFESVAVTAGNTPGSKSNGKLINDGIAFRKTFFSNLQGLFFQGAKEKAVPGQRILHKCSADELLETMPNRLQCDETDVKTELKRCC